MDGARNDDALGNRRGNGVERHECTRLLVQHHNVTLAPDHLELLGARHMRDVCGAVARRVNQIAAAHITGRCHQRKTSGPVTAPVASAGSYLDRLHRCGAHKRHAVGDRILHRGDGDLKRIDIAGRGTPQRARGLGAGARLQLVDALGPDDRQLGYAVCQPVALQLLQLRAVLVAKAQHHGPGAAKQKAQLLGPRAI